MGQLYGSGVENTLLKDVQKYNKHKAKKSESKKEKTKYYT